LGLATALVGECQARESELKRDWAERRFLLQDQQLQEEARLDFLRHSLGRQVQRAQSLGRRIANMDGAVGRLVGGLGGLAGAKANLQAMITLVRRVQMLQAGLGQLRALLEGRRLREMPSVLMATMQLAECLGPMIGGLPKLGGVLAEARECQMAVWQAALSLFQSSVGLRGGFQPKDKLFLLADAALLVEILGPGHVHRLVDWYCDAQLRDYKAVFRGNREEWGALTALQKRFHWLARLLEAFRRDRHDVIFAESWQVPQRLCIHFCALTATDIADSLKGGAPEDAAVLLSAVKECQAMEAKLYGMFPAAPPGSFALAGSFEGRLHLFLALQEAELQHFMAALPKAVALGDVDGNQLVASASTFWLLLRDAVEDIAALDSPATTAGLFPLLGRHLCKYAAHLQACLPKKTASAADVHIVCVLLNTATFCLGNGERLLQRWQEQRAADSPGNQQRPPPPHEPGLEAALQAVHILASLCLNALEAHLAGALAGAWEQMAATIKAAWATGYQQGDRSPFTMAISEAFARTIAAVSRSIIRPDTLAAVVSRLARSVLARFRRNLWACRPISESGAQQLLVDLHAIRSILREHDRKKRKTKRKTDDEVEVEVEDEDEVETEYMQIEALVKAVLIPLDPPGTFVETYLVLIGDADPAKFRRTLQLKGKPNAVEQARLMQEFLRRLPDPPSAAGDSTANPQDDTNLLSMQQLRKTIRRLSISEGAWRKLMAKVAGRNTREGDNTPV
jgi:hypothetical protein